MTPAPDDSTVPAAGSPESEPAATRPVPPRSAASAPEAPRTPPGDAPRRWWRRLRRGSQATPPDPRPDPALDQAPPPLSLQYRNPFQIGFLVTLGGLLAFGMLAALSALQSVVLMGVLSLFLALGLNPAVEWFTRRGAPSGLAVAIVALTLVALLVLGAWAVLPLLTEQVNALVLSFPAYLQGLRENPSVADLDAQFQLINRASQALTSGAWVEGMFGGILGAGVAIANVLFSAFVTLVLTLWFLAFLPGIKNTIYQLAPASRRPRVRYLAGEVFRRIGGYMSGLFLVVSLAAGAAFIFLNLVGLGSYSLALAVVVAGFAFIPLVGPTIAMLIVAVVAFSTSVTTGVITVIFFLVYQQIDAYLIQPRIFQRSVNVPGPLIVIAALSGGILFGIPGALIAIPTVASALLIYREVLIPALDRA
ncbi:AI-2E family transporter [Propioniciclava flava]